MDTSLFINKKILITGGAGFIGTNLIYELLKIKGVEITIIDNFWRGNKSNIVNSKNVRLIEKDLSNYEICLKYIKNVDIIYHLAEIVCGVDYAFNNQSFIFRQNVIINSNVLNAAIENNIKNYIYVGSACSYPKISQNRKGLNYFSEEDINPLSPETSYGMSKYLGEYEAELAKEKINIGILRLHNVYGPYSSLDDNLSQVIPSLIKKSIKNNELIVWGSGNQYRDFVYVNDVVKALLLVFINGMNKGVIQIGTGIPVKISEISKHISKLSKSKLGKNLSIIFDTEKLEGDFGRLSINKRANEILNWYPQINMEVGLEKTFDWCYNNLK